ncbi:MAG: crossover junction endodeoxyribonuclease RuvC [Candidatus Eisenbacteria bacterium]
MRVLGVDPGSRRTGYGVVEKQGNRFHCVLHGHVSPKSTLPLAEKLLLIAREVGEVIDRVAPDCVVIEEAFYHESVRSILVLGHVRGALMVAAAQRGIEVAEYSPREIKLSVTGNGAAAKEQVAFMVRRLMGLTGTLQSDAADALAGAVCHLSKARFTAPRASSPAARRLEALLASKGNR